MCRAKRRRRNARVTGNENVRVKANGLIGRGKRVPLRLFHDFAVARSAVCAVRSPPRAHSM